MYGENGEVEYGGDSKNADVPTHNVTDDMTQHYFQVFILRDFEKYGIDKKKLNCIIPQKVAKEVGLEITFLVTIKRWENYYYAVENCGFEPEPDGRSEGTYSKYAGLDDKVDGYHFYFAYLKFGHSKQHLMQHMKLEMDI